MKRFGFPPHPGLIPPSQPVEERRRELRDLCYPPRLKLICGEHPAYRPAPVTHAWIDVECPACGHVIALLSYTDETAGAVREWAVYVAAVIESHRVRCRAVGHG